MGAPGTPAPCPLGDELADALDDLAGLAWLPGMSDILTGIRTAQAAAAAGELTLDQTQTYLSGLADPHNQDLTLVLALLARCLTNPATNPALLSLDLDTQKDVQHLGEIHVFEAAECAPRDRTNEAAGLIYEGAFGTVT